MTGTEKGQETRIMAAKEYHTRTRPPEHTCDPDASCFRVVAWGYYRLMVVIDDYSPFNPGLENAETADWIQYRSLLGKQNEGTFFG